MYQLKRSFFILLTLSLAIFASSCTPTTYTTQSKANTYNDYKAAKYNVKTKKKKKY